ncbi:hypothetical protein ACRTDU_17755 [Sunxiuqinia elliptica]|uniref:Phosphoribosylpyrophosphate synthetase n=1 Tax=Sunxiuqinia elliptica TaxID=655355 RepID=A0A1I2KBY8_9BACT|nr:hypothetical protein [Sunxiuqinia elliptica]SFF63858.1 hypothetical protein SAMN05216283_11198 [Sunxiuqinia elliptica]
MKHLNNQYSTLVEALNELAKRGFTHNFRIDDRGLITEKSDQVILPKQVTLQEFHRFEGMTNPSDMSIVYAIETNSGLKGTIVDSYGASGSEQISEFMNQVIQKQFD